MILPKIRDSSAFSSDMSESEDRPIFIEEEEK